MKKMVKTVTTNNGILLLEVQTSRKAGNGSNKVITLRAFDVANDPPVFTHQEENTIPAGDNAPPEAMLQSFEARMIAAFEEAPRDEIGWKGSI